MNTYIDQAYELYENKQWKLAQYTIVRDRGYQTNPIALNLMGSIYWKLGDKKEAKKYYLLSAKCQNDFWPAYLNLGNLYHEMDQLDKAIKYYKGALSFKENHFQILYNIGTCYLKKKKLSKAIFYLKSAHQQNPTHLNTNINIAKSYYLEKNYRKSFLYFNTALALDEQNNSATIGYHQSWARLTS